MNFFYDHSNTLGIFHLILMIALPSATLAMFQDILLKDRLSYKPSVWEFMLIGPRSISLLQHSYFCLCSWLWGFLTYCSSVWILGFALLQLKLMVITPEAHSLVAEHRVGKCWICWASLSLGDLTGSHWGIPVDLEARSGKSQDLKSFCLFSRVELLSQ